jgi:hypothetical protein
MSKSQANFESISETGNANGNPTIAERFRAAVAYTPALRRTDRYEWLARMNVRPRRAYRKAA